MAAAPTSQMTSNEISPLNQPSPVEPDLSQCNTSLLLTFELGEDLLTWTAVSRRRARNCQLFKGAVEIGYNDIDNLAEWMTRFFKKTGNHNHEIHLIISGPEIAQRCFMVPVVPRKDLGAIVKNKAKKVFPFELKNALFGWKTVDQEKSVDGKKYEIFAQALAEYWNQWLTKLFGNNLDNLSLITSVGQRLEEILGRRKDGFEEEDSYVVRLNANILETGFYHKGHLEFFREVPVDSLTGSSTVTELKMIVGIESDTSEDEKSHQGAILADIKSLISDALDYYHGQFGQRDIKTVYLCVKPEFSEQISQFVSSRFAGRIVNINEGSHIAAHCKLTGITTEIEDYPRWGSVLPVRKVSRSVVNLLPVKVVRKKIEARNFRYSLIALFIIVVSTTILTVFKMVTITTLQNTVDENKNLVAEMESSPVMFQLGEYKQRTTDLQTNVAHYNQFQISVFRKPLLLLSHYSQEQIRLNRIDIVNSGNGQLVTNITGEVRGPKDRQELVLFTYLSNLEKHPAVRNIRLTDKNVLTSFGKQIVNFSFQLETK